VSDINQPQQAEEHRRRGHMGVMQTASAQIFAGEKAPSALARNIAIAGMCRLARVAAAQGDPLLVSGMSFLALIDGNGNGPGPGDCKLFATSLSAELFEPLLRTKSLGVQPRPRWRACEAPPLGFGAESG
jgi:hypothetical protein